MKHANGTEYAKLAAQAHTNLSIYYAVIGMMEGGHLTGGRFKDADRIIKICKQAAGKELQIYDAAMEKLK